MIGVFDSSNPSVPAVSATGTDGAIGVEASSDTGRGVVGTSGGGAGVVGGGGSGFGVIGEGGTAGVAGESGSGAGVFAQSQSGIGVHAVGGGATATTTGLLPTAIMAEGGPNFGVLASSTNDGTGILATSDSGTGVNGASNSGKGVIGFSGTGIGVNAGTDTGFGIVAQGGSGIGVFARSGSFSPPPTSPAQAAAISAEGDNGATGINVTADTGIAVIATSNAGGGIQVTAALAAVTADSSTGPGVQASSETSVGVRALSLQGTGVHAIGGGTAPSVNLPVAAVFAEGGPGIGVSGTTESGVGITANGGSAGVALQVIGKVQVQGNSVGSVTMAANTKTLTVANAAATANSLILLTPLDNPHAYLWIGARSAGNFTIDASQPLPANVTIMFLIVN